MFDSQSEPTTVRMDGELRWAGDAHIRLLVGKTRLPGIPAFTAPVPIDVTELRFSAVARIELLELRPILPCFRAVSLTFMKKPLVDFSLQIAKLDVMNLGPADFNVTTIVRNLLHSSLSDVALYPKKIVIPLQAGDADLSDFTALHPVGILYITFKKGVNLHSANIFGSDPYILAKSMHQEVRTATKYYSLNPEWNETHDFMVYDKATQEVEIQVTSLLTLQV